MESNWQIKATVTTKQVATLTQTLVSGNHKSIWQFCEKSE